jgi:hypothetical protein
MSRILLCVLMALILAAAFFPFHILTGANTFLTQKQCHDNNGVLVNTTEKKGSTCAVGRSIGSITDVECPCICCVGEHSIDCEHNKVEITDACDAGTEVRLRLGVLGRETPRSIQLHLGGDRYDDTTKVLIVPGPELLHVPYRAPLQKGLHYSKILSAHVEYTNAPLSACDFDFQHAHQTLPIANCDR